MDRIRSKVRLDHCYCQSALVTCWKVERRQWVSRGNQNRSLELWVSPRLELWVWSPRPAVLCPWGQPEPGGGSPRIGPKVGDLRHVLPPFTLATPVGRSLRHIGTGADELAMNLGELLRTQLSGSPTSQNSLPRTPMNKGIGAGAVPIFWSGLGSAALHRHSAQGCFTASTTRSVLSA
jgi:hypothetical protein